MFDQKQNKNCQRVSILKIAIWYKNIDLKALHSKIIVYHHSPVEVVAAITADPIGDHAARWTPPPPIRFRGTLISEAVFQMYMEVSEAQHVRSRVPWGFHDTDVTGWWYLRSSLSRVTQAAEGLATTDIGSMVQIRTPEAHPTASSEAEYGRHAMQATWKSAKIKYWRL